MVLRDEELFQIRSRGQYSIRLFRFGCGFVWQYQLYLLSYRLVIRVAGMWIFYKSRLFFVYVFLGLVFSSSIRLLVFFVSFLVSIQFAEFVFIIIWLYSFLFLEFVLVRVRMFRGYCCFRVFYGFRYCRFQFRRIYYMFLVQIFLYGGECVDLFFLKQEKRF